jgi:hypothetical protein
VETVLGLLGIAVFIVGVIAVAAAVTWTTVKLLPTEKPAQPKTDGD